MGAKALGLSVDEMGTSMDMVRLGRAKPFDRARIDMMIPRHEGAIRMARTELAKGQNPKLRKIAEDIVGPRSRRSVR